MEPDALATCDVVVLNFGQWAASGDSGLLPPEPPRTSPWSEDRYERAVADVLAEAQAAVSRSASARLLWATTHPHGISARVAASQDWRTPHVLRLYARASARAAASLGVPVIDAYNIGAALHDLSYDGAHYAAPVESEIARAVHDCATTLFGEDELQSRSGPAL